MDDRCIVVGASAGGVEALRNLVSGLPGDLAAPVFVVLHIPPYVASELPGVLSSAGPLPAIHAEDGAKVRTGVIHVAPPDHHMLIEDGQTAVKKGPRENRFRPSIHALFRSAAYVHGPGAIGVILSGALDDGTSGLWSIKRLGGTTVIQDPDEARFASMPRSSLDFVEIDHSLPSRDIGPLLGRLLEEQVVERRLHDTGDRDRMGRELRMAADNSAFQKGVMDLGELTPFTCPACHGVLIRIAEGRMSRFRCHTGHAYTDNALLESVMASVGEMLWQVIRSMEESVMLLEHMGGHLREAGDPSRAEVFLSKAQELEERSAAYHSHILSHESLSGDNLAQ